MMKLITNHFGKSIKKNNILLKYMNPSVSNWINILVFVSLVYWLVVFGSVYFPRIHPLVLSVIATGIVYLVTSRAYFILFV
jgi:hypothetical protein